jgi:SWI/SNF-related matrix-associated actin-dependent regulator of chromatin subfamily A member 5
MAGDDRPFVFETSPSCKQILFRRNDLITVIHSPYQLQGLNLNWMVSHHIGLNGGFPPDITAVDDSQYAGLGKTLQTISFLAYRDIYGPHLVVVPKSTLQNWSREFEKLTSDFKVVLLAGTKDERAVIIANQLIPQDFEVCVTTYEMCLIEKSALR